MGRSQGVALALAFAAACASEPPAWVFEADRGLVGPGGASRVEIEVDAFEQVPPDPAALSALKAVAERECEGKTVSIRRDDPIPAGRWADGMGDRIEAALDACRGRAEADPDVAYVHVLYCPANPWGGGSPSNGLTRRRAKPFPHWEILIFKGTLDRRAVLTLKASALDRSCLVHEFGHALGLVANSSHRFESHGGHCTDPKCVMTLPNARAVAANAVAAAVTGETPWDFCDACRDDLARSRAAR